MIVLSSNYWVEAFLKHPWGMTPVPLIGCLRPRPKKVPGKVPLFRNFLAEFELAPGREAVQGLEIKDYYRNFRDLTLGEAWNRS
jgi:hypothetical protein